MRVSHELNALGQRFVPFGKALKPLIDAHLNTKCRPTLENLNLSQVVWLSVRIGYKEA